jgi:hypothetical protein
MKPLGASSLLPPIQHQLNIQAQEQLDFQAGHGEGSHVNIFQAKLRNVPLLRQYRRSPARYQTMKAMQGPSSPTNPNDTQQRLEKLKDPFLGKVPQVPINILPQRYFTYSQEYQQQLQMNQSRINVGFYQHNEQRTIPSEHEELLLEHQESQLTFNHQGQKFIKQPSKKSIRNSDIQNDNMWKMEAAQP